MLHLRASAASVLRKTNAFNIAAELEYIYRFCYQAEFGEAGSENELCHVFLGRIEGEIRPNDREIESIRGDFGSFFSGQQFSPGDGLIDKIIAYKEHGSLGWVPFLAVYLDGEIKVRINALDAAIFYKGE